MKLQLMLSCRFQPLSLERMRQRSNQVCGKRCASFTEGTRGHESSAGYPQLSLQQVSQYQRIRVQYLNADSILFATALGWLVLITCKHTIHVQIVFLLS